MERRRNMYDTIEMTAGSSVLGIRYDRGVMIAADTLVSYGNEKCFDVEPRVFKVNENIVIGGSGDFADFQFAHNLIDIKMVEDMSHGEPDLLKPSMMSFWLSNLFYQRQQAKNPLSCEIVMGGLKHDGTPYLAGVDRYGGYYNDYVIATGAANMGMPMIYGRKPSHREYTAFEVADLIVNTMTVMFYRNCSAVNNYLVAICERGKCGVYGPFQISERWGVAAIVHGY